MTWGVLLLRDLCFGAQALWEVEQIISVCPVLLLVKGRAGASLSDVGVEWVKFLTWLLRGWRLEILGVWGRGGTVAPEAQAGCGRLSVVTLPPKQHWDTSLGIWAVSTLLSSLGLTLSLIP